MDKALKIYSYILKEHLAKCFNNVERVDPVKLNQERFKSRAIFISAIIFLKNNFTIRKNNNIISQANYWLKNSFAHKNLFSSIIENSNGNISKLINDNLCNLIGIDTINITNLYEALLTIETQNKDNVIKILNAKNYRNKLGSYYTPNELAKAVTEHTIDSFFELHYGIKNLSVIDLNDIDNSKQKKLLNNIYSLSFADFSCGSGNFLIEIIKYFEKFFYKLNLKEKKREEILKSIALNIFAFDVDCLALEVAKINLLLKINSPSFYSHLNKNFIHANFLLHTDFTNDNEKKVEIFANGFVYHEQLSLNRNILKKYDIILGNPPWEKIRFEEKSFYTIYSSNITNQYFKSTRTNKINEIELRNIYLAEFSNQYKIEINKAKSNLKQNSFFALSNSGELNTYALFTEAAIKLMSEKSIIGLVLKSAIATSQVNQRLFKYLTKQNLIIAIYDFINRKKIFNIDCRERFCFLLLGKSQNNKFDVLMNLKKISEIQEGKSDIKLSHEQLRKLNPITGMLPNFTTKKEMDFLLRLSSQFSFLKDVFKEIKFGRIVHLTNHANYISTKKNNENVEIYEGKFFHQFDGKFSGFNEVPENLRYGNKSSSIILDETKKKLIDYLPESRFFINKEKWLQLSKNYKANYMLAWRSLTSATNTRTCIATILPFMPASQSVQFLIANETDLLYLNGLLNSIVFDFILKKKLCGIDLTQSVINQIPIPNLEQMEMKIKFNDLETTIKKHISLLVYSLLKHDIRLNSLFENIGIISQPTLGKSRLELILKIDLLIILLYSLSSKELEMVLESFNTQYSKKDLFWFENELKEIKNSNNI